MWSSFNIHTLTEGSIYVGGNASSGGDKDRFTPIEISYKTTMEKTDSIVYTYNGDTKEATFYANGVKIAQKIFTEDIEEIQSFIIPTTSEKQYSRITFYNKVLDQSEIANNYQIDKYRFNIK